MITIPFRSIDIKSKSIDIWYILIITIKKLEV